MRSLQFWIAAVALAVAAGAITALWPGDAARPPAPPPPSAPAPPPAAEPPAPPTPPVEAAAPPAPAPPPAAREEAPERPDGAAPGEPSRALVREVLKNAFAEKLPERRLTEGEFDELADAILRMRAARQRMAKLPLTPENAEELARLREELTDAAADFEYVAELTPSDFTAIVDPDIQPVQESVTGGEGPEEEEEVILEYLHDTPPR